MSMYSPSLSWNDLEKYYNLSFGTAEYEKAILGDITEHAGRYDKDDKVISAESLENAYTKLRRDKEYEDIYGTTYDIPEGDFEDLSLAYGHLLEVYYESLLEIKKQEYDASTPKPDDDSTSEGEKGKTITCDDVPLDVRNNIIADGKENIEGMDVYNYAKWKQLVRDGKGSNDLNSIGTLTSKGKIRLSNYSKAKGIDKTDFAICLKQAYEKDYKIVNGRYVKKENSTDTSDSSTENSTLDTIEEDLKKLECQDISLDTKINIDENVSIDEGMNCENEDSCLLDPQYIQTEPLDIDYHFENLDFEKFKRPEEKEDDEEKCSPIKCLDLDFENVKIDPENITKGNIVEKSYWTDENCEPDVRLEWEGTSHLDKLMHFAGENLRLQYDSGRIVGGDYATAYTQTLGTVMQLGVSMLTANEELKLKTYQAYLDAKMMEYKREELKEAIKLAKINQEIAWANLETILFSKTKIKEETKMLVVQRRHLQEQTKAEILNRQLIKENITTSRINREKHKEDVLTARLNKLVLKENILSSRANVAVAKENILLTRFKRIVAQYEIPKTRVQIESLIEQTRLYERQRIGFDDNMMVKLLKANIDSYAMMYSAGMIDSKNPISVFSEVEMRNLYDSYKRRVDGRWNEASEEPLEDENGKVTGIYVPPKPPLDKDYTVDKRLCQNKTKIKV